MHNEAQAGVDGVEMKEISVAGLPGAAVEVLARRRRRMPRRGGRWRNLPRDSPKGQQGGRKLALPAVRVGGAGGLGTSASPAFPVAIGRHICWSASAKLVPPGSAVAPSGSRRPGRTARLIGFPRRPRTFWMTSEAAGQASRRLMISATSPVQPVWWLAPSPAACAAHAAPSRPGSSAEHRGGGLGRAAQPQV
jgi:hypothetical protein